MKLKKKIAATRHIHSVFQQILLIICCQPDILLGLLRSWDFILWALEVIKVFKQGLAWKDYAFRKACLLQSGKIMEQAISKQIGAVSIIKARDDSGLN